MEEGNTAANFEKDFACLSGSDSYMQTPSTDGSKRSCSSNEVLSSAKKSILLDAFDQALLYFKDALRVERVQGKLRIDNPFSNCQLGNGGNFNFACCPDPLEQNPTTLDYLENGIDDTDFVVHVTARPNGGNTLAWAVICQQDTEKRRPIQAQVNIGPGRIPLESSKQSGFVRTIIHELMHGLGFSRDMWGSFWDPSTETTISSAVTVFDGKSPELAGKPIQKIMASAVAAKVKEQFDCSSWDEAGGELEDSGGSGTAGSHWEKRIFFDEIMTGTKTGGSPISAVTLALFEATGWYEVDYSLAEENPWGRGEGCDFARRTCGDSWNSRYFCIENGQEGCTFDNLQRGSCRMTRLSGTSVPSYFQYFSDPELFGRKSIMDFCPIYEAFSNGDCRDEDSYTIWWFGDSLGSDRRCFTGNWKRTLQTSDVGIHAGCLRVECDSESHVSLFLRRGDNFDGPVPCPREGGSKNLATEETTKDFWTGSVECPPADEICTSTLDDSSSTVCSSNSCSGNGDCEVVNNEIQCTCDEGWGGDECACPTDEQGEVCSERGTCQENSKSCDCQVGYHGSSCELEGCPVISSDFLHANCPEGETECECAGNGDCSAESACQCFDGFIGTACDSLDCPAANNSTACGSNEEDPTISKGTCAVDFGVCQCTTISVDGTVVHYTGRDCSIEKLGKRPIPRLQYSSNSTSDKEGVVFPSKEYVYFVFEVDSTEFPLWLKVEFTWEDPITIDNEIVVPDFQAFASYSRDSPAEIQRLPSITDNTFSSITINEASIDSSTGLGNALLTMEFSNELYPTEFDEIGDMIVAFISTQVDITGDLILERDDCAKIECIHGTCKDGQCQCRRFTFSPEGGGAVSFFGWTGPRCDSPECPGSPDCGGFRGSCVVPEDSSSSGIVPFCECTQLYEGQACEVHNLAVVKYLFGAMSHESDSATDIRNALIHQDSNGTKFIKNTYSGVLDTGAALVSEVAIDLDRLLQFDRVNSLPVSCNIKLTSTKAGADPMLFLRRGSKPTLKSFDEFDAASWADGKTSQEISTRLSSGAWFIGVYNGRYGTNILNYTMEVEISTGCSSAISGCSGHGFCSSSFTCACDTGYAGTDCSDRLKTVSDGTSVATRELLPGEWEFFVLPLESDDMYIKLNQLVSMDAHARFRPSISAMFQRGRDSSAIERLKSGTGQAGIAEVITDFDAHAARKKNMSMVLNRTPTSRHADKEVLYIGIKNEARRHSGAVTVAVDVLELGEFSSPCSAADDDVECQAKKCFGRGTLSSGSFTCRCDIGWNDVAFCGSPLFSTFARMNAAAQMLSSLCSLCSKKISLKTNELHIFRLTKPLRRGIFHEITVKGASSNSSASRILTSASSNAALLLSSSLPRSVRDFYVIRSSSDTSQSLQINHDDPEPVFWVTVYGNSGGEFTVQSQRKESSEAGMDEASFPQDVANWLVDTNAGTLTLSLLAIFIGLAVCCICADKCGSRLCPTYIYEKQHKRRSRKLPSPLQELGMSTHSLQGTSPRKKGTDSAASRILKKTPTSESRSVGKEATSTSQSLQARPASTPDNTDAQEYVDLSTLSKGQREAIVHSRRAQFRNHDEGSSVLRSQRLKSSSTSNSKYEADGPKERSAIGAADKITSNSFKASMRHVGSRGATSRRKLVKRT